MRSIITDMPGLPANAPILTPSLTADEQAIYAAGPSLWLEGAADWMTSSGGAFSAWTCRASGQAMVPALAAPPLLPAVHAGRQAVRFGFGATGYNVGNNGVLRPRSPAFRAFPASGKYTMAALVRCPIPSGEGGTELTGNSGGEFFATAPITEAERAYGSLVYGTGQYGGNAKRNTTSLIYAGGYDDAVWRMIVHSQDVSSLGGADYSGVVRVDGVQVSQTAGALSATSTTDNASVTASVAAGSDVMTVSAVGSGTVKVGQLVIATGIPVGTKIASLGTSTGGTGTVILDNGATAAVAGAVALDGGARTVLIGGGGATYTQQRFVGDIGGMLLLPDVAAHRDAGLLAAIEAHFSAALAALKS